MSGVCENLLLFSGSEEALRRFRDHVKSLGDQFPRWLAEQEEKGKALTGLDSAIPWEESVSVSVEPEAPGLPLDAHITWQSRRYPSIQAVFSLSTQFPELTFTLDYDAYEDLDRGSYVVVNGELEEEEVVDYDAPIVDLLEEAGMLKLGKGERIEVGTGMVEIECVEEAPAQEGGVLKTFEVRFQCDASPRFQVRIDPRRQAHYLSYSDDEGNTDIEDNSYAYEMRGDLQ